MSRRIQNALGMIHTSFARCVCYTEPAQTNITQLTNSSSWACWPKENVWRRAECAVKGMSEVLSCFCRASAPEVYENIEWLLKTQSRVLGYFARERGLKIISAVTSWTSPAVADTARWSVQQKSCLQKPGFYVRSLLRTSRCTRTQQTNRTTKTGSGQWMFTYAGAFFFSFLSENTGCLKTPHPDLSNIQQAAVTLRSNPSRLQPRAFNKQRKQRITLSLPEKLHWREKEGGKKLQLFNKSRFIWSTDKEKWRGFFFSGPELHMTAIWGYCVFWPKRVVYDRWQERKSRAAGFSTDMQIAFSWLLHSARYLSSGLQYASSFTARKQLINSTKGRRKESRCWVEGENSPKWPEN